MRKLLFAGILFITGVTFGQNNNVPDTLVKLGGKKTPVYIKNVTSLMVYYALPAKPKETLKVERKNVEKIIYKTGRVENFNQAAFKLIEEGQWEAVLITYDEKDVAGLYKRGVLLDNKSAPSATKKKAEQNVLIKLQKRAANMKGTMVLITRKEFYGGYGDDAGCIMDGIIYGTEPLEEGTDVIQDSSKKDDNKTTGGKTSTTKPVADPKKK